MYLTRDENRLLKDTLLRCLEQVPEQWVRGEIKKCIEKLDTMFRADLERRNQKNGKSES